MQIIDNQVNIRYILLILVFSFFSHEFFAQKNQEDIFFTSKNVDFIQITSSITDCVKVAVVVYKPDKPSPILLTTHGWHGSVRPPAVESKNPHPDFLTIQVDMRGRQYSTGKADCNGLELVDLYDAYGYAVERYSSFVMDKNQVYYLGSSGGGGNGYAIIGKFPDLLCSAVIGCGISDYADWYKKDTIGEFRDEMLPWIGVTPDQNMEAYQSRSGITTVENILTPVYIIHGETDIRVPVSHARNFYNKAVQLNKQVKYLELKKVGTRSHWGNITEEQLAQKNEVTIQGLKSRKPPELPSKGRLIVAGYIVTKHFSVFLDSIDSVGIIKYNIKRRKIRFFKGQGTVKWST
jgi:pimeloyl-ACP methyl ester carboxylesterase